MGFKFSRRPSVARCPTGALALAFVLTLMLMIMAGCADPQGGPDPGFADHNNPTVRDRLKGATERYFDCVYKAIDKNIRFVSDSESRPIIQVAVEDCRAALKILSRDVARINIETSVARGLVESAERHGYAIAREGLRLYYETPAAN